MPTGVLAHM